MWLLPNRFDGPHAALVATIVTAKHYCQSCGGYHRNDHQEDLFATTMVQWLSKRFGGLTVATIYADLATIMALPNGSPLQGHYTGGGSSKICMTTPWWLLLVLRNILVFVLKICLITFVRVRVLFLKTLPNQAHIFINEKNNNNNIKEVCRLLKALPNV
jgi:hypothetical protein